MTIMEASKVSTLSEIMVQMTLDGGATVSQSVARSSHHQ